jgi:hypothetical protein
MYKLSMHATFVFVQGWQEIKLCLEYSLKFQCFHVGLNFSKTTREPIFLNLKNTVIFNEVVKANDVQA